ncbi:hypothetical protein JCM11017A_17010 [Bacteroides fragilis]
MTTTFRSSWFIREIVSEHSRLLASRKERKSGVDKAYFQIRRLTFRENLYTFVLSSGMFSLRYV